MNHRIIIYLYVIFSCRLLNAEFQAVDLNSASKEQIELLPGVGKKKGEAIIAYRAAHNGFKNIEELRYVEGMKPKLLASLLGKIVVQKQKQKQKQPENTIVVAQKPSLSLAETKRLVTQFPGEPSIQQVQEQAIHYASMNPERVASWLSRIRYAPWLPHLDAGINRVLDRGLSVRERTGDPNTFYTKDSANWELKARAEWKLNDLIFDPAELHAARESVRISQQRNRIVERVTESYFERRRVQLEQKLNPPSEPSAMTDLVLQESQLTADIDGLTGGWFSHQLVGGIRE